MCTALSIRRTYVLSSAPAILSVRFALGIFLSAIFLSSAPQLRAQSSDGTQQSNSQQQSGQDVAEAARRERARKQRTDSKHVYTNEDLRRANILTQEDQLRAAANRKQPAAPSAKRNPEPVEANSTTPQEPLGDVARRYRNLKKVSPFHLPTDQAILAAPKIAAPNPELKPGEFKMGTPVRPEIPASAFAPVKPSAPVSRSSVPSVPVLSSPYASRSHTNRIDPFAPRRVQPAPPVMFRSDVVRPNLAHPNLAHPNLVPPEAPVLAVRPNDRATILPRAILPVTPKAPQPATRPTSTGPVGSVIVQPGDTLWSLSREHLGRGTRWLELLLANPGVVNPERLTPGTSLVLPSKATNGRHRDEQSIIVQQGDSLSKIARATYGHSSYWPCVAHANPTLANPNLLAVGQSLTLPVSCGSNP